MVLERDKIMKTMRRLVVPQEIISSYSQCRGRAVYLQAIINLGTHTHMQLECRLCHIDKKKQTRSL